MEYPSVKAGACATDGEFIKYKLNVLDLTMKTGKSPLFLEF
jgi:hypothetical protein